jgi:hypothetical protein
VHHVGAGRTGGRQAAFTPERAPKDGTFAGFASLKTVAQAGVYTISLSVGAWVDVVQDGHFLKPVAFSGATDCDGIRKTMKYELSAQPRTAGQRREGQLGLDRDPAERVDSLTQLSHRRAVCNRPFWR